jgi:hypothetical protein
VRVMENFEPKHDKANLRPQKDVFFAEKIMCDEKIMKKPYHFHGVVCQEIHSKKKKLKNSIFFPIC